MRIRFIAAAPTRLITTLITTALLAGFVAAAPAALAVAHQLGRAPHPSRGHP